MKIELLGEDKSQHRKIRRSLLHKLGTTKLLKSFGPVFNSAEKSQVVRALKVLTDTLDTAGIEYFLYGGSLIGSWRHHDVVPWDDDVDIIVNISKWQELENLRIPGYTLNIRTLNRYKFYSNNATDIPSYFWKWPYIDICFFGDNGTHLYDMDPVYSKLYVYDKQDIYPLVRRPFGDLNLKSPRDTLKILEKNYNINICQTRTYNHQKQKQLVGKQIDSVDCRHLHKLYPFVIRTSNNLNNQIENLYLDGTQINSVDLHSI